MSIYVQDAEAILSKNKSFSMLTIKESAKYGLSRRTISKKVKSGEIIKMEHGIYVNSAISPEELDFFVACQKFGDDSVIGGLSALFFHELIDQPPEQVWVIVPVGIKTIQRKYRLVRTKNIYEFGIENHKYFRVLDINRTIVESFRFSSKTGLRTAFTATVRAVKEKKTTLAEIMKMAKIIQCENTLKKHWETIVGILEA